MNAPFPSNDSERLLMVIRGRITGAPHFTDRLYTFAEEGIIRNNSPDCAGLVLIVRENSSGKTFAVAVADEGPRMANADPGDETPAA